MPPITVAAATGLTMLNRPRSPGSVFLMSYAQPVDTHTALDRGRRDEYQEARRCFAAWIAGRMNQGWVSWSCSAVQLTPVAGGVGQITLRA